MVNSPFNYADFVSEFKNGVGNIEGMHFSKFTFIENNQTCVFASNVGLYLGDSLVYEIKPNYEAGNYNIIFDGNNGELSYNFATYRYGIACWIGVEVAPGSEVHILGGDGGEPYEGGVAGERGDDLLGGISGAYYGSDGYVPAKEN